MNEISASGVIDLRTWAEVGLSATSGVAGAGMASLSSASCTPAKSAGNSPTGTELFET